jgi:hypothetical protein
MSGMIQCVHQTIGGYGSATGTFKRREDEDFHFFFTFI